MHFMREESSAGGTGDRLESRTLWTVTALQSESLLNKQPTEW